MPANLPLKVSVFIATSLDGFIAREDGSLDWLDEANKAMPPGEDCGYLAFMDTVDVLVMGRHTFEKVLTFGAWPYGTRRVIILSRRGLTIPAELAGTVSVTHEEPLALVDRLTREGLAHVYVDGGVTIQGFLRVGLVDELILTRIPVLIGRGRPLFGPLDADLRLTFVEARAWPFGFVQERYVRTAP